MILSDFVLVQDFLVLLVINSEFDWLEVIWKNLIIFLFSLVMIILYELFD